jgi:hypothetical protein
LTANAPPAPLLFKHEDLTVRLRGRWIDVETAHAFYSFAHADMFAVSVVRDSVRVYGTFQNSGGRERWIGHLPPPARDALCRKLASVFVLPRTVTRVLLPSLAAEPTAFDGRWIEVEARWSHGFEVSHVAGLWFEPVEEPSEREGSATWRIVGRVDCRANGRYGHLGASPGQLTALEMSRVGG